MKFLIMGAGALGSVFGGFLRKAGYEVALIGRNPHMQVIQEKGLHINGIWGEFIVDGFQIATEAQQLVGEHYDVALICVKSHDTVEATQQIVPLLKKDGLAISIQNGLGNAERLANVVGLERAAAARVIFGAEVTAPGNAVVTVCADDVVMGIAGEETGLGIEPRLQAVAQLINDAGVPTKWVADVKPYLWAKTIYNSALNPLAALLGVKYGTLAELEATKDIMNKIIEEIFVVARAKNVVLPWNSALDYQSLLYDHLIPLTAEHRASMLQDLEQGRRTEIGVLNGKIVEYGSQIGIATPVNEVIVNLIKARELLSTGK